MTGSRGHLEVSAHQRLRLFSPSFRRLGVLRHRVFCWRELPSHCGSWWARRNGRPAWQVGPPKIPVVHRGGNDAHFSSPAPTNENLARLLSASPTSSWPASHPVPEYYTLGAILVSTSERGCRGVHLGGGASRPSRGVRLPRTGDAQPPSGRAGVTADPEHLGAMSTVRGVILTRGRA